MQICLMANADFAFKSGVERGKNKQNHLIKQSQIIWNILKLFFHLNKCVYCEYNANSYNDKDTNKQPKQTKRFAHFEKDAM